MNVVPAYDRLSGLEGRFTRHNHGWWLYAMRPIGETGPIKLGRSYNPAQRRRTLERAGGQKLEIVTQVPEYVVSEAEAHRQWAPIRLHGEWFEATPELLAWLEHIETIEWYWTRFRDRLMVLVARKTDRQRHGSPLRHIAYVEHQIRRAHRASVLRERRIARSRNPQ